VCRPQYLTESRGSCLCLKSARNLMTAAAEKALHSKLGWNMGWNIAYRGGQV
jgi:hypothetical protein